MAIVTLGALLATSFFPLVMGTANTPSEQTTANNSSTPVPNNVGVTVHTNTFVSNFEDKEYPKLEYWPHETVFVQPGSNMKEL
jgi:hypothetical protein